MPDLNLIGGTVVSAEGSFAADIAIRAGRIANVASSLASDGVEQVDVTGLLLMPGFIDGHTHMEMPFAGTVAADDWDTGTAAALAGGTTTVVDFSLQEIGQTLEHAVRTWQAKASDKARIDYGLHVAITDLTTAAKDELADLPALGVCTVKLFMAYKGTPLFTSDEDLFETLQRSKEAGVLAMVHAENGDVIAKLQEQALSQGNVSPRFHALTRPEEAEAEATGRAIRLAEIAGAPLVVVHVTCEPALAEVRRARRRGTAVFGETCPHYLYFSDADLGRPGFEGAKFVCSPPLRDPRNRPALWRGLQTGDLALFGSDHCAFNLAGQKELGLEDFTLIPNGMPGAEERPAALWSAGVRTHVISPEVFVAVLSTNQARIHGLYPRKGTLAPGADADVVVWDPELELTVTHGNRHGAVDYTGYEGLTFRGGPAAVYLRGELAYAGGEILSPPGTGRFVERTLTGGRVGL